MARRFLDSLIGGIAIVAALAWPVGSAGAQTARQIAAELFDFPILETGQPTVFGARLGCEQSLIDEWDELQTVLLLAAFDPAQLQAALDRMHGDAFHLQMCVKSVHDFTCTAKAIEFVSPSVTGTVAGGVVGHLFGLGASSGAAIGGGLGAGGALLHLGVCNKRKVGAMEALRVADIGDYVQQPSDLTLTNVLLIYRDAKQRLDPAAWVIVAEHTHWLEKSAIESMRQVR